jgi:hypothetical protein
LGADAQSTQQKLLTLRLIHQYTPCSIAQCLLDPGSHNQLGSESKTLHACFC